ncbi:TPA: hypothetical protein ACQJI0_001874 [Citrobacter freundii]
MDGAKDLAKDMLEAINVDDSGFIAALVKGLISFPVSMGYLAYDFMDTEHRRANEDDKYRFARLINKVGFNKELVDQVVGVFIDDFSSRLDVALMAEKIAGNSAGRMIFSELTGVKIGAVISNRLVTAFFFRCCYRLASYAGSGSIQSNLYISLSGCKESRSLSKIERYGGPGSALFSDRRSCFTF